MNEYEKYLSQKDDQKSMDEVLDGVMSEITFWGFIALAIIYLSWFL